MFRTSARSATFILLALYAATVLALLGQTPLWLDEVQQFGNTRHGTIQQLLRWVQVNAGASPLPYLAQRAFVDVLGYSAVAARLRAAICSILSGVVFAGLCTRFMANPKSAVRCIAVAMFLILPLQFRYGLEARVYSQGLLFSLLSMWLFLRLGERPSLGLAVLYGIAVALGLYSQPLTCFPALAHLIDGRSRRYGARDRAAGLSFLPWYVLQRQAQAQYALISKPIAFFSFRQVMPQVLLHDLTGGGYACTAALLLLAAWTVFRHSPEPSKAALLGSTAAISLAGPIFMDILFNRIFSPSARYCLHYPR